MSYDREDAPAPSGEPPIEYPHDANDPAVVDDILGFAVILLGDVQAQFTYEELVDAYRRLCADGPVATEANILAAIDRAKWEGDLYLHHGFLKRR